MLTNRTDASGFSCWLVTLLAGLLLAGCGSPERQMDELALLEQYNVQGRRHDPIEYVEVDLGEFFVPRDIADSSEVLFVKCHMFAIADKKDRRALESALVDRRIRMRDMVMAALRQTELEALTEPSMNWLKSELIPSINKVLKSSAIRDIVLAEFSLERG